MDRVTSRVLDHGRDGLVCLNHLGLFWRDWEDEQDGIEYDRDSWTDFHHALPCASLSMDDRAASSYRPPSI